MKVAFMDKKKTKCNFRVYPMLDAGSEKILFAVDFTCDEVRFHKDEWLQKFRDENGNDRLEVDNAYEKNKKLIEDFLSKCTCVDIINEK